ncbi:hypothetical protein Droror1_Dr00024235, partial [Drosera rotundifolia]
MGVTCFLPWTIGIGARRDARCMCWAIASGALDEVKLIIEEIERKEAALQEDLYSADGKFAEYYNVLEQVLEVLIKLVKDLKLQHQHEY